MKNWIVSILCWTVTLCMIAVLVFLAVCDMDVSILVLFNAVGITLASLAMGIVKMPMLR